MFSKILIANRGEIACRIIRTARQLGIATVAVYSDADEAAMHVALADEAVFIGPAPARESYLDREKILAAARLCGAQAIHPGYGFLSENAEFADACRAAGFTFVGPPSAAIRAMGDKAQAKALMEKAEVPLVPGYHRDGQDPSRLAEEASAIGYPVLLKPAAGGGGKGMKIAGSPSDFMSQLESAKREAASAFGGDRILIEKYLPHARHVEVQVFADSQQNFVHLFDRDCSIQRRHQKIIEEAPAPGLSAELRRAMAEAAISAAGAVGYVGAGTVEFLLSPDGEFYFLEMNTRLQVEHPVTEMITGIDLVAWQIQVAAGAPLPLSQEQISVNGHAIEARLYAEDPRRDFLPQAGRIERLDFPEAGPRVRVDAGVRAGDTIPVDYDPMIAKLIVWGSDRDTALFRLQAALADIRIVGLATNLSFLRSIAAHAAFRRALPDTAFVERYQDDLLAPLKPAEDQILAMAVIGLLLMRAAEANDAAQRTRDPASPWNSQIGWRLNEDARESVRLHEISLNGAEPRTIGITYLREGWRLEFQHTGSIHVAGSLSPDGTLIVDLEGHRRKALFIRSGREIIVFSGAEPEHRFLLEDKSAETKGRDERPGRLTSPMPGRIAALLVETGARVEANQPVMVLEAMKMEHMLRAPKSGIVKEFRFKLGDQVAEGIELALFEADVPSEPSG